VNYLNINLKKSPSYLEQLKNIWWNLRPKRKYQLIFLLIMMLLSGLAEVFSLTLIVPFLSVLTDPDKILTNSFIQNTIKILRISDSNQLLLFITFIFALAAILSAFIRFINSWLSFKLTSLIGSDLSYSAFTKVIYSSYEEHIKKNSSETISAISTQLPYAIQFILNTLRIISSLITLVFIICTLFTIYFKVTFAGFLIFGVFYIFIAKLIKNKLIRNGILFKEASNKHIKALQESIGALRDISLNRSQKTFLKIYRDIDYPMRKYVSTNLTLSSFPKYFIEAFALVIIAIIAYIMSSQKEEFINVVPIIGTIAFGAQKLLPNIQEIFKSWANQKSFAASVETVISIINRPVNIDEIDKFSHMKFKKNISFNNVSFSYSKETPKIINELSIDIPKGQKIGIIGSTGSGKSTFIDLLIGLLEPTSGNITIDGIELKKTNPKILNSWRASISNVPQNLFLLDRSFKENIAFGIPIDEINHKKVISAAKKARISEYIERTHFGYDTSVGERGLKLSGGQKQRIGIARALYRDSDVIVLDEATSALDSLTEKKVIENIKELESHLTILIITHRLATLEYCDRVIKIEKGSIVYDGIPKNI
tara:strand:+ start:75700 stop:77487 length:1788 start_codon:yes stop_codon:yes gene_type:complete